MLSKEEIEKDILIAEDLIIYFKQTDNEEEYETAEALENILADRERLEKENMKMQVEIAEQVYFGSMPIEEMKQLQVKANKYDSLVEKIKQKKRHFEEYDELIATSNDNYSDGTVIKRFIDTLQELLDTEK